MTTPGTSPADHLTAGAARAGRTRPSSCADVSALFAAAAALWVADMELELAGARSLIIY
jgi:hypothetical protein